LESLGIEEEEERVVVEKVVREFMHEIEMIMKKFNEEVKN
jgi:hypothetical protein